MANTNALTNKESSLSEIVADIKKGYYVIPCFQRGVVWKIPDICKLGDSLLWGYPISSLLLMPTSSGLDVTYKDISVKGLGVADTAKSNYVLDGQQRLTAAAKLFIEGTSDRVFYYDLLGILIKGQEQGAFNSFKEFQEGGIFEEGLLEYTQNLKPIASAHADYVCRAFNLSKRGENDETKANHRYIRCDVVLNSGFGKYVNKFLRAYFESPGTAKVDGLDEAIDICTDYLTGVFGALRSYGVPVTLISEGSDLELVCSIFERVNSSGVKLTTFDLVNAKTFGAAQYEGGFAAYLSDRFSGAKALPSLQRFFDGTIASGFADMARVIRILHMADKLKQGSAPELSNGAMLRQKREFWFNSFDASAQALYDFIDWAETSGFTTVAPKTFVEYMAAVVVAVPGAIETSEFKRDLLKYARSLGVHSQNFTKSNMKTVMEFLAFAKNVSETAGIQRVAVTPPAYLNSTPLTKANILDCKYSGKGSRYAALMDAMYGVSKGGRFSCDLFGVDPEFKRRYDPRLGDSLAKIHKFDEHHLVPKGSVSAAQVLGVDSIANIVLLSREKNNAIGSERFEDYVKHAHNTCTSSSAKDSLSQSFALNLVPGAFMKKALTGEGFDADAYNRMLEMRAEGIAEYINDYLGFDAHAAPAIDCLIEDADSAEEALLDEMAA